jgi:hypothetical protein
MKMTRWYVIVGAVLLCACSSAPPCDPEVDECATDAGPPEDICNSKDEAFNDSRCEIPLGADAGLLGFIGIAKDGGVDSDFYSVKIPSTVTPRTLVHISAGYAVPATPVNLAVSVLREDGNTSLARKIDKHGAAAPRPVDIVFPYGDASTRLLVLLSDEGAGLKPNVDNRNQYEVKAEVLENPDSNEPNDVTPTVITLTGTSPATGTAFGALATDDDVDKYSFTAPGGRKILYLHITGACATFGAATCNTRLMPEPPFRVGYVLFDKDGKPVAEGQAKNEFIPVDLATARLTTAGEYTLVVSGYKAPNMTAVTPGDLRMIYKVELQLLDDLDTNEPNDSIAQPKVVPMAYGSAVSFTGRLGYVPDPDVFALDLAGSVNAGVLRYKLTGPTGTGRFPPLAPASDRQVRVVTEVNVGATRADRENNCKTNSNVCPKGYEGSLQAQSLIESLCGAQDPPWCTWAERNEDSQFANLRNMEGAIPVPAHGGTRYYLFVQDDGNDYADDRDYKIDIAYEADPDDTARAALPFATQQTTLSQNASFPVPASVGEVTGTLSFGYGRTIRHDINKGEGIRAGNDYDAVPNDFDRFEMALPAVPAPIDRSWALQWDVLPSDAGTIAGQIALEVNFCTTGTLTDGGCTSVDRVLAYSPDQLGPWYSNVQSDRGTLWKLMNNPGGGVTVTAEPLGCFCFEPRVMSTGHFIFKVGAVDRDSNAPISYRIRQSIAPYPQGYVVDGGSMMCPAPGVDGGGCRFTN